MTPEPDNETKREKAGAATNLERRGQSLQEASSVRMLGNEVWSPLSGSVTRTAGRGAYAHH